MHSLDGAGVGARGGLGEAEGGVLAGRDARQVLLLLLGRAEQQDALEPDGLVRAQRDAHAQVVRAYHLPDRRIIDIATNNTPSVIVSK